MRDVTGSNMHRVAQPELLHNLWECGGRADFTVVSAWETKCPLAEVSDPLSVCTSTAFSNENENAATTGKGSGGSIPVEGVSVPIFTSRPGVEDTGYFNAKNGNAKVLSAQLLADGVGFAGGSIYGAEWCPRVVTEEAVGRAAAAQSKEQQYSNHKRLRTESEWRYLAVSVCSDSHRAHSRRKPLIGTCMIQLWRMPNALGLNVEGVPEMKLGMLLEGSVTWDMFWCPGQPQQIPTGGCPLLGLVACAHGNGPVAIYAVPSPTAVGSKELHPVVEMEPIARFDLWEKLSCLPRCLHWLPTKPHDLLLVGTWCGQVLALKILYGEEKGCRLELVRRFRDQRGVVRSVSFPPPKTTRASEDGSLRHHVTVAGDDGGLRVYDLRDAREPVLTLDKRTRSVTTAVKWIEAIEWMFVCDDGGAYICFTSVGKEAGRLRTNCQFQEKAALTTCDVTTDLTGFEWCATAGEQGTVTMFALDANTRVRNSNPGPQICSQMRATPQGYRMYSPYRVKPKQEASLGNDRFPDEKLAVASVRFASVGTISGQFNLAICYSTGFLRIQTLSIPGAPDVTSWAEASWFTGDERPFSAD